MSKRIAFAVLLASVVAACQQQQPDMAVTPTAPVSVEPVYQGKYGS